MMLRLLPSRSILAIFLTTLSTTLSAEDLKVDVSVQERRDGNTIYFGAVEETAPFSYKKEGHWIGYTIDLCRRIYRAFVADHVERGGPSAGRDDLEAELEPKFLAIEPAERFKALRMGKIDALCEATTITVGRMKDVNFSLMTFVSGAGLMSKRDTSIGDLQRSRRGSNPVNVGYVKETTTASFVKHLLGSIVKPVRFDNHDQAFQALKNGTIKFYFADRSLLRDRMQNLAKDEAADFKLAPGFLSFEPYAIPVRKENDRLLWIANKTLAELYRSGEINRIYEIYFPDSQKSELLRSLFQLNAIPE